MREAALARLNDIAGFMARSRSRLEVPFSQAAKAIAYLASGGKASGKASGTAPCKAATPASTKKAKEQAAKEQKAAETVQKHMRGSIARTKVENMKRPCDEYSVNMNAANFGECMCGWPKADHATSAFVKKRQTLAPTKVNSADLRNRFVKKAYCPCTAYRVNLQSENFGECMCGEPKDDHSPEALAAETSKGKTNVDSAEVRSRFVTKTRAECDKFEPDMSDGVPFGTCKNCGEHRSNHSEAALSAAAGGKKGTTRMDSGEVRKKFVARTAVECELFEPDMSPNAQFGVCKHCGNKRVDHSDAALRAGTEKGGKFNKAKDDALVRKGFEKTAAWADRETCACEKYVVDLSPNVPFGQCICGEPKAAHSDAALAAR